MSAPQIVDVRHTPENEHRIKGRLIGLHISNPEGIGMALGALGVAEAEIPDWTVFTSNPGELAEGIDGPYATLSPFTVSLAMRRHIGKRTEPLIEAEEDGQFRYPPEYIHAFGSVVGPVVLHDLAHGVADANGEEPSRRMKVAASLVPPLLGGLTYTGLRQGIDLNPGLALGASIATYAIGGKPLRTRVSPYHFASQRVEAALQEHPHLAHQVGKSVLPVFDKTGPLPE